mmetsp:Transcript_22846/g.27454  ORF Transcript_22846/g.27454 Transcript_22846/m.27454 type:complete len:246 (+) Transcript_22846:415-1152(+)
MVCSADLFLSVTSVSFLFVHLIGRFQNYHIHVRRKSQLEHLHTIARALDTAALTARKRAKYHVLESDRHVGRQLERQALCRQFLSYSSGHRGYVHECDVEKMGTMCGITMRQDRREKHVPAPPRKLRVAHCLETPQAVQEQVARQFVLMQRQHQVLQSLMVVVSRTSNKMLCSVLRPKVQSQLLQSKPFVGVNDYDQAAVAFEMEREMLFPLQHSYSLRVLRKSVAPADHHLQLLQINRTLYYSD